MCSRLVKLLTAALLASGLSGLSACAPFPVQRFVPEINGSDGGQMTWSACALNHHLPEGIEFTRDKVKVAIRFVRHDNRHFVDVDFGVPSDRVVQLLGEKVLVLSGAARFRQDVVFDGVSRVGSPLYLDPALLAQNRQALDAPMPGFDEARESRYGKVSRHYWLAAAVAPLAEDDVWVELPPFAVSGVRTVLPRIHFQRKPYVAVAVFNC